MKWNFDLSSKIISAQIDNIFENWYFPIHLHRSDSSIKETMDMPYEFLGPRKIIFGENSIELIPNEMRSLKKENPLIVTDRGIAEAGILDRLLSQFDNARIQYKVFSEVEPDPEIAIMERGKKIFHKGKHDLIVALGGGSSIDTGKVISVLATNKGRVKDYTGIGAVFKKEPIPMIAVPTTAGTGSEVTSIAVVTDKDNKVKLGMKGPQLLPTFAVLDPTLLKSLPPKMIAYTGIDAFSHALESFLSIRSNLITQQLSLAAVKLIYHSLIPFKENPRDVEPASKMLYGSCLAGIAFTNGGLGAVHALAHSIGSHYHLPHGLACALFLPRVLRENKDAALDKYEILFEMLGYQKNGLSKENCADRLIEAVDELIRRLDIPTRLGLMGIKYEVLPGMVSDALKDPPLLGNPKKLDQDRIKWLLESVR
jgi:alcohol dehydrogenase class IV